MRRLRTRLFNIFKLFRLRKNNTVSYTARIDKASTLEGSNLISGACCLTNSHLGRASYMGAGSNIINTRVGRYTSIGSKVTVIRGQHPTCTFVSTHPVFYSKAKQIGYSYTDVPLFDEFLYLDPEKTVSVMIGSDVWIGANVLLLEGVKINDGAIVAAGAVVTKDIPPYAVVGGVPAKIIRYRFDESDIDFLLHLKWWDKEETWIRQYAPYFKDIKLLKNIIEAEKSI